MFLRQRRRDSEISATRSPSYPIRLVSFAEPSNSSNFDTLAAIRRASSRVSRHTVWQGRSPHSSLNNDCFCRVLAIGLKCSSIFSSLTGFSNITTPSSKAGAGDSNRARKHNHRDAFLPQ